MKVIALVVTYNRLASLQRCLECLQRQSFNLQCIVVVNNASTDGTWLWLSDRSKFIDGVPVVAVHLVENTGGAGGFAAGLSYVLRNYAEGSVWIMDDDAYPEVDSLERLVAAYRNEIPLTVLAPAVLCIDSGDLDIAHRRVFRTWKEVFVPGSQYEFGNSVEIDTASFVGLLMPVSVIRRIGIPYESFFVWFDDTEYTLRLREAGCQLKLVPGSRVIHGGSFSSEGLRREWGLKTRLGVRNQVITYRLHMGKFLFLIWYIRRIIIGSVGVVFCYTGHPGAPRRLIEFLTSMVAGLRWKKPELSEGKPNSV